MSMPVDAKVRGLVVKSAASAARQGLPVTVCPYEQGSPRARELARLWVGAYLSAKPPVDVDYDAEEPEAERARNELKDYWLRGEGAARWSRWTELYNHLRKHLGDERAKRTAAEWFHERYGRWPGSDANRVAHGKPPRGDVVGPG